MWRAASVGRQVNPVPGNSSAQRALRPRPAQSPLARTQIPLPRSYATESATTARSVPIFRYVFTLLFGSAVIYTGAAYYALNDAIFRKYWIENVPGGQPALDQVALASEKLKNTSVKDLQTTASETAATMSQKVDEAKAAANKQYESALTRIKEANVAANELHSTVTKSMEEAKQAVEDKVQNVQTFVGSVRDGAVQTYEQTQAKIKETEQQLRSYATKAQYTYEDIIDSVEEKYEAVKSTFTGEPAPPKKVRVRAAVEVSGPEAAAIVVTAKNVAKDGKEPVAAKAERAVADKAKEVESKAERAVEKVELKAKEGAHEAAVKSEMALQKVEGAVVSAEHVAESVLEKGKAAVGKAVEKAESLAHDAAIKGKEVTAKVEAEFKEGAGKLQVAVAEGQKKLVKAEAKVETEAKAVAGKVAAGLEKAEAKAGEGLQKIKEKTDTAAKVTEVKAEATADKVAAEAKGLAQEASEKSKEVAGKASEQVEGLERKAGAVAGAVGAGLAAGVGKVKDSAKKVVEEIKEEAAIAQSRLHQKADQSVPKSGVVETSDTVVIQTGETDTLLLPQPAKHTVESKPTKEPSAVSAFDSNVDDLVAKLPQRPVSLNLVKSISALKSTLDDLRASAPAERQSAYDKATNELTVIVGYLNTLEVEDADLIRDSLRHQEAKFRETLKDHEESTKLALDEQAKDLGQRTDQLVEDERRMLVVLHNEQLANKLSEQAAEFRSTLDADLRRQAEELERHWTKEVKTQVDLERQGRLARLDHLALKLKFLEKISIDAGESLDRSYKVHRLWSALKAVQDALERPYQGSFAKELAVLEGAGQNFGLVEAAVSAIPASTANDGVPTLFDLEKRFEGLSSVVRRVQLMPESGGGPVSYAVSNVMSLFVFKKKGLVPGDDVESVLARAEFYLKDGDLETATRELNQLKGWPKRLSKDWLEAARRHLEVKQALEVVETHLNLLSLGVV
ncbi:Formation of crista junctions protein 1 [Rhizophlyctis rosea]|nr:Formation of crista junctions protein 1 [Rhizophlyctis rosea]